MNIEKEIDNYLCQVPHLTFNVVTDEIWKAVQNEGLDKEFESHIKSDWSFAKIKLTDEDVALLKNLDNETLNKFNKFDIRLKDDFDLLFIDLINYEKGEVLIVTPFLKVDKMTI